MDHVAHVIGLRYVDPLRFAPASNIRSHRAQSARGACTEIAGVTVSRTVADRKIAGNRVVRRSAVRPTLRPGPTRGQPNQSGTDVPRIGRGRGIRPASHQNKRVNPSTSRISA